MDSDSNSSNSPHSVPAYYRLNSEVHEKPSHFQHSDCEESLEILALLSSPEESSSPEEVCVLNYGGQSPCSSSKGDGSNGSDFEGIGDEDEGFDEEFEFFDNDEVKDASNNPNDIDINDKDLQRILIEQSGIPLSSALDDFDPGVVFEEPTFQSFLDNSFNKPSSPYQHIPSPGVPVTSSEMATVEPDSTFVDSGSYYPTSSSFIDFEPIQSCCDTLATMTHNTADTSWLNPSPTLASVNVSLDSIDLNEASRIMSMSIPNLVPVTNSYVSTPASPHTPMSAASTPSSSRATRSLSPAPPSHTHNPPATPPSHNSGAYYIPSPAESSKSNGSTFSNVSFNSTANAEKQAIVDLPFHKFKKVLDDNTVPEEEKERLKAIRRRGKNKRAAYNCRKKKITMICGLQQEIDQMRAAKERLAQKSRSLEQEIARWKQLCTHRVNCHTSR